jgi:hypothetical protein
MKNTLFTSLIALLISFHVVAQTCNDLEIKDGAKSTLIIKQFSNPLNGNSKFMNAKVEKRDVQIAAYNADVLSGKIQPSYNSSMDFTIKRTELKDAVEYSIGYKVGEEDFYSYLVCKNDTVYSCRNRGPVRVGTPENIIGYSIQGILTYPLNMKVGDVLPSCEDVGITFPATTDMVVKKQIFSHYAQQASSSDFGFYTDSRTGENGFGAYTRTPPAKAIFKTIEVNVKQTYSCSSHAIQGVNQRVTAETEVTVGGIKYKAFIIESESWSKTQITTSYESAHNDVARELKNQDEIYLANTERQMIRKNFTNKLGYMVQYSTGWFVPKLGGSVKIISYDIYGGISTVMLNSLLE